MPDTQQPRRSPSGFSWSTFYQPSTDAPFADARPLGVVKRLIERLEHHDALLEQPRVIRYRRAQPVDKVGDRCGVRRLVPIFLEIDVVHELGVPFDGGGADAEAILQ